MVHDTIHAAGAPTIARERPQNAGRSYTAGLDTDTIQLTFYYVTISKLENTKGH